MENTKLQKNKNNDLFKKVNHKPSIYFIHSYYVGGKNRNYITSTISFGKKQLLHLFSLIIYMVYNFILKKVDIMV